MQHTALARDHNSLAGIPERDVQGRLLGGDEECPAAVHYEQRVSGILVHGVVEVRDTFTG